MAQHTPDSKEFACHAGDLGSLSGWENPLEEGMATCSSVVGLPWWLSEESAYHAGDPGSSLGRKDPLEEGMATHSSILGLPWWLRG